MSKPERRAWEAARELFDRLDPIRVENSMEPGTPDVNYSQGWVELKSAESWPKRPGTPFTLRHPLSPQQQAWLKRRSKVDGRCHVLVKIGTKEWLLMKGDVAAHLLGTANKQQLLEVAVAHWTQKPTKEEFQRCLLNP